MYQYTPEFKWTVGCKGLPGIVLSDHSYPPCAFIHVICVYRTQVWRLFTNFFFFGLFTIDFLFHMYFMVRYCRLLEEGSFRGKTADLVFLLLFGAVIMTVRAGPHHVLRSGALAQRAVAINAVG